MLLGEPPARLNVRGGSLSAIAPQRVAPGLPSDLLLQRPDIREVEAQLSAANANVESARAALFPSISLTGQGGFVSTALNTLFIPQSAIYSVAASVTQPVFDGLRLLSTLDLQKARRTELLQLYRKAIISGFADVERALRFLEHVDREGMLLLEPALLSVTEDDWRLVRWSEPPDPGRFIADLNALGERLLLIR